MKGGCAPVKGGRTPVKVSRSPIFRPLSALGRSPPICFRSEAVRIWCGLGPLASILRRTSSVLFGLLPYCSRPLPFLLLYSARFCSLVMLRCARTSSYHRHADIVVYKDPLVVPWEATVLRPLVSRRVLFLFLMYVYRCLLVSSLLLRGIARARRRTRLSRPCRYSPISSASSHFPRGRDIRSQDHLRHRRVRTSLYSPSTPTL